MRLLFRQRFFSWLDSYDIYDEAGDVAFTVKGKLAWGHCFKIFDKDENELGTVKQRVFTWLPKFDVYIGDKMVGTVKKHFTFFKPKFDIDYNGWSVNGSFTEWDYTITDALGKCVATVSKQLFEWSDTYVIDVARSEDALSALMLVVAIDAEKCSRD